MHKYQPRIHIIRDSDMPFLQMGVINTFTFPETVFIAVTAYQNEQVKNFVFQTVLCIAHIRTDEWKNS